MSTWLNDFIRDNDLDRSALVRFRGGIGVKRGRETVSSFVGHPVHYLDAGQWKPITLEYNNGRFEGSLFGWNEGENAVTYNDKVLFKPNAMKLNGIIHPLHFRRDGNRFVSELPFGIYEILFLEGKVKEVFTVPDPIDGLLEFDILHVAKPGGLRKNPRRATDESGLRGDTYQLKKNLDFPFAIDPDYSADSADGRIAGTSTTYATARSTATGHNTTDLMYTGQLFLSPNYSCYRAALIFSTAGIPDSDEVTQNNVKLVCTADSSTYDFDVEVVKYDWSTSNPIGAGNRDTVYDGILAATLDAVWRNTNGMSLNVQYTSSNLDTSWVSKTGDTYYGLRSAEDYNNSAPTDAEWIKIASQEHATSSYRPVLTVVHAAGGGSSNFFF